MIKTCERCGSDFEVDPRYFITSKYCSECQKIVAAEQRRQWTRHYRKSKLKPKTSKKPVVCQRCGKMIDASKHGQRKWCDDCRKTINREYKRQYRQRLAKSKSTVANYAILPQPKTYTCRDCGEKFTSVERTTVCPECKRIQLEELRRRKNEQLIRLQSKSVKTLTDWIREARECNLDYGTYRALRNTGKTFEELKIQADGRQCSTHSHVRKRTRE